MPRRLLHPILLTVTLAAVAGCESKFNRHNFEMIRVGVDDQFDVRQLLGKPDSDMGDVWMYDDFNHRRSAQILFGDDGRVLNKEWMDADSGEWTGGDPWADQPARGEPRETRTKTRRYEP
jgi:hypothetical protein